MAEKVILLTVDSLAAGHVGCLGYEHNTTPRLDALAREGCVYTNAVAQSSHTRESMPSLFYSSYSSKLSSVAPAPTTEPTIATEFASNGFSTAGFHSNPYLSRAYGFGRGFDTFEDSLALGRNRISTFLHRVYNHLRTEPYVRAETLNGKAISWLKSNTGKRQFLWLHYMDPHGPYQPPSAYRSQFTDVNIGKREAKSLWRTMVDDPDSLSEDELALLGDLYDAEIRYTDAMIGDFHDRLGERGWLDETTLVVAADHGEAFGQHDTYGHPRRLYEELIHVPLFLFGPDVPRGRRVSQPVENVDVAPTLLKRAGCECPETFAGEPLPVETTTESDPLRPVAVSECREEEGETQRRRYALRTKSYMYSCRWVDDGLEEEGTLVTLNEKTATDDLASVKQYFADVLDDHVRATSGSPSETSDDGTRQEADAIVEDRLRDLGYR